MRPPDRVVPLGAVPADDLAGWERLASTSGAGYFSGPTWCTSWYDSFGGDGPTQVGVWGADGTIDAVVPMVRVSEPVLPGRLGRRVGAPVWQNAGTGPGGGDHVGVACRDDLREDALEWATGRPGTVRLRSFPPSWGAALLGLGAPRTELTRTYAVSLTDDPRPGSKKLWKHITRSRRLLVDGGTTFDHLVGTDIDRDLLRELFSLHGMRSAAAGRSTTFTVDRLDFHTRLASRSTSAHASFVVRARHGGALAGALYGFLDESRVHYYQSGWDPEFERSSLGSVLIGEAIDLAVQRGAIRFDFLRGDEPYKLRFGAEVALDRSVLLARGASGLALRAGDSVRRIVARRRAARDAATELSRRSPPPGSA